MNKYFFLIISISILSGCSNTESQNSEILKDEISTTDTSTNVHATIQTTNITRSNKTTPTYNYNITIQDLNSDSLRTYDTLVNLDYVKDNLESFHSMNYPEFKLDSTYKNTFYSATLDSFKVEIQIELFDSITNKIDYEGNSIWVNKINNKLPWGIDGNLPTRQFKHIKLFNGNKEFELDKKHLSDLFNPNFSCYTKGRSTECFTKISKTKDNEIIIYMLNSDGAGSYKLILILSESGKLIKRIIGYGV